LLIAALLVAGGSAVGGVLRWLTTLAIDRPVDGATPWLGTLAVNVVGCAAIGVAAALIREPQAKLFVMTGVLGGFTTFSAFALQNVQLAAAGRHGEACACIGLSLAGCLAGTWAGLALGTRLAG